MNPQSAYPVVPSGTVIDIMLGTVFLFVGMAACCIAALRRCGASLSVVWFGLFIGMYGLRMLADVTALLHLVPDSPWPDRVVIGVDYVLVIPALLFWTEVSAGILQRMFRWLTVVAACVAVLGLGWFAISGKPETFLRVNSLLAICLMVVIGILVLVPKVARKYLTLRSQRSASHCRSSLYERRLFSIDTELETARQIQSSILPDYIPSVSGLRIAATYRPMSAVAGDFYQFLEMDDHRVGILVADVSGHGVPAALIASMIKVAMQSAVSSACSPAEVLGHLNRILTPELKGRLTSAAYLWLDAERGYARYSAAGHPPLLHWKGAEGRLRAIECNGLLLVWSEAGHIRSASSNSIAGIACCSIPTGSSSLRTRGASLSETGNWSTWSRPARHSLHTSWLTGCWAL